MASLKWFVAGTSLLNLVSANLNVLIAPPVTAAPEFPHIIRRQESACLSLGGIVSSCIAATRSFTALPVASRASCLCANPDSYDDAFGGCLSYLSTASPDVYSSYAGGPTTPCEAYLSSNGGGAATTTRGSSTRTTGRSTITSSASIDTSDPNYQACSSLNAEESSCEAATPRFTSLSGTVQASCLCYQDGQFAPEVYDENRQGCISYLKTANPTLYQSFIQNGGNTATSICSSIGDVAGSQTSSTTRRTSTASATPTRTTAAATTTSSSTGRAAPTGIVEAGSFAVAAGALALAILL